MSATTDVIATAPAAADEATLGAPPEDFSEFKKWSRAQDRGEEPPKEKQTLPEAPAETPAKADKPEAETAAEPGTEEERERGEGEEEHAEKADKPEKVQKRIDRLTRDKYELKGRIAALEEQLTAGRPAEKSVEKTAGVETEPVESGLKPKPKFKDFLTEDKNYEDAQEEYTEALTDWKLEQREKTRSEQARKTEAQTAYETKRQTWDGKVAELRAKPEFEDYDDRMEDTKAAKIIVSDKLDYAIFVAGPEVAYRLACNLPELQRIAKLDSVSAALEIGAIKASLKTTAPETKPPAPAPTTRATSAPRPITPVGGAASGGTPSLLDDRLASDFTAWKKVRRAQDKDR